MTTMTLTCAAGHTWERPAQRGRPPRYCPEHRSAVRAEPRSAVRAEPRSAVRAEPRGAYVPVADRAPAERNAAAIARIDAALALYPREETARVLESLRSALSRPRNEERDGPYADLVTTLNIHLSQNRIDV